MTTDLRVMTWVLLALPLAMLGGAFASPFLVRGVLLATSAFVVLVYASVWYLFRPTSFVVDDGGLRIDWPMRTRHIARASLASVRTLSKTEFRREYGPGMRVGAGGLFGGFGLLVTSRGTLSMWISRTDAFVLVELRGNRALLLTPADPDRFAASVQRLIG